VADLSKEVINELKGLGKIVSNSVNGFMQQIQNDMDKQNQTLLGIADGIKALGKNQGKNAGSDKGTEKTKVEDLMPSGSYEKLIKYLNELSNVMPKMATGFGKISKSDPSKFTTFMSDMTKAVTLNGKYTKPLEIAKLFESVGGAIKNIADSLTSMAMGLLLFNMASKAKADKAFIDYVKILFSSSTISMMDPVKAKTAGQALSTIGTGILDFGKALVFSAPLFLIGLPGLLIATLALKMSIGIFSSIGKINKEVNTGANALVTISKGIFYFSAAMAAASVLMTIGMVALLLFIPTMSSIVNILNKLGELKKQVETGSLTLANAGRSVLVFAMLMAATSPFMLIGLVGIGLSIIAIKASSSIFTALSSLGKKIDNGALTLMTIGRSVLLFSMSMAASIPFMLLGFVGIGLATLAIKASSVLFNSLSTIKEKTDVGARVLTSIGKSILKFSMEMAASLPFMIIGIPAILLMVPVIGLAVAAFRLISTMDKTARIGERAMLSIGRTIFLFSLELAASSVLLLLGIPALLMMLPTIGIMVGTFALMGRMDKSVKSGADAIKSMGIGMLTFSAALLVLRFVSPADIGKALLVIGVLTVFSLAIALISRINKGEGDIGKSMFLMSAAFAVFGLSLLVFKLIDYQDILKATLALVPLALLVIVANKFGGLKTIFTILAAAAAFTVIALSIAMFTKVTMADIGKAALSVGLVSLLAIVANAFGGVKTILTLIAMAGAVMMIAYSMQMFKSVGWETIGMAGAAVGGAAAIALLLGASGPIGILGAATMILIGVAMLAFAGSFMMFVSALSSFKKSGWKENDTKNLVGTIGGLLNGIGAPLRDKGLLGGITTFISGIGGTAMLAALGLALFPFVAGLERFKKLSWKKEDSEHLNAAIASMITGLSKPLSDIGKSGGFLRRTDFAKGVSAISGLGKMIFKLAEDVQKMSNLQFTDPETKKVRNLNSADFVKAGANIKAILEAVSPSIEHLGKSGGFFYRSDFKKGMVAIKDLGNFISNLAKGVIDMANGKYTDEKGKQHMVGQAEYALAASNIKAILETVSPQIEAIGKTGGFFYRSDFKKGMVAIKDLGNFISNLAKGVIDMANGKYTDEKGKQHMVGPKEYKAAGDSIAAVIAAMRSPIEAIGKSGGFFTRPDFKKGMDSIHGLGDEVLKLSQSMVNVINLQKQKVDFKNNTAIADMLKMAVDPIKNWYLINVVNKKLNVSDMSGAMKNVSSTMSNAVGASQSIAQLVKSMPKPATMDAAVNSFKASVNSIMSISSTSKNPKETIDGFSKMSKSTVDIANKADALSKAAGALERIAISMTKIADIGSKADVTKVSAMERFMKSITEVEKVTAETFNKKIDKTKELLTEANKLTDGAVAKLNAATSVAAKPVDDAVQLKETMDTLIQLNRSMLGAMTEISRRLSGTLSVDVTDGKI
jgi:hypothetical protein